MKIDQLINDYFEGRTSCEEERQLRLYFASDGVREDLRKYKPLFAYFEEEIASAAEAEEEKAARRTVPRKRRTLWYYPVAAAVACVLLLLGWRTFADRSTRFCGENYVVVNGRCYTDIHKIRSFAKEALEEVSNTDDMLGLKPDDRHEKQGIVEDQLKEFDFLLEKE